MNGSLSFLRLLKPSDYVMSVDQTKLWRRHVAWAKSNSGAELRDHLTHPLATYLIVLSLILVAEVTILVSPTSTDMREAIKAERYDEIDFYLGLLLILGCCISLVGLLATLSIWSMTKAISDNNAFSLLRSSVGQNVSSYPSRFVCASLYLLLLWMILFLVDLIPGPARYVVILVVLCLFCHVMVTVSTFGRLILHGGGMGREPVLDRALERDLLPSGLQAALMIKAKVSDRRRSAYIKNENMALSSPRTPQFEACEREIADPVNSARPSEESNASKSQTPSAGASDSSPSTSTRSLVGYQALEEESEEIDNLLVSVPRESFEPPSWDAFTPGRTAEEEEEEGEKLHRLDAQDIRLSEPITVNQNSFHKAVRKASHDMYERNRDSRRQAMAEWTEEHDVRQSYNAGPPSPILEQIEASESVVEVMTAETPAASYREEKDGRGGLLQSLRRFVPFGQESGRQASATSRVENNDDNSDEEALFEPLHERPGGLSFGRSSERHSLLGSVRFSPNSKSSSAKSKR